MRHCKLRVYVIPVPEMLRLGLPSRYSGSFRQQRYACVLHNLLCENKEKVLVTYMTLEAEFVRINSWCTCMRPGDARNN